MGTDVFAVIAEGTRREILRNLRAGDKAVGELVVELQVSQPTVSKHLKVLREAGLVTMRAQGQKRYYSLETGPLVQVMEWLAVFEAQTTQTAPTTQTTKTTQTAQTAGSRAPVDDPAAALPALMTPGTAVDREEVELAAAVLAGTTSAQAVNGVRPPIGRTMGRAAERAADLLAQLRRRRES